METILFHPERDKNAIQEAAAILRRGGLLGIPTETVYGLGADGLNEDAVRRIFEAKGRPQDNPLILHIPEASWLTRCCIKVSKAADCIPVIPIDPISSLSASTHTAVFSGVSMSSSALKAA